MHKADLAAATAIALPVPARENGQAGHHRLDSSLQSLQKPRKSHREVFETSRWRQSFFAQLMAWFGLLLRP
jgi:hypothetical protein